MKERFRLQRKKGLVISYCVRYHAAFILIYVTTISTCCSHCNQIEARRENSEFFKERHCMKGPRRDIDVGGVWEVVSRV